MDKYEFNMKVDQITTLMESGNYTGAMQVADTIDWRRVKNVNLLSTVAAIYEHNREFEEAKDILLMAFEKAPVGKRFLFKLTELSINIGDIQDAQEFYEEFCEVNEDDSRQYILRYLILRAKGAGLDQLIGCLEQYLHSELDEVWLYELANLYANAGREEECIRICDKIIIMFGQGSYVDGAAELKRKIKNSAGIYALGASDDTYNTYNTNNNTTTYNNTGNNTFTNTGNNTFANKDTSGNASANNTGNPSVNISGDASNANAASNNTYSSNTSDNAYNTAYNTSGDAYTNTLSARGSASDIAVPAQESVRSSRSSVPEYAPATSPNPASNAASATVSTPAAALNVAGNITPSATATATTVKGNLTSSATTAAKTEAAATMAAVATATPLANSLPQASASVPDQASASSFTSSADPKNGNAGALVSERSQEINNAQNSGQNDNLDDDEDHEIYDHDISKRYIEAVENSDFANKKERRLSFRNEGVKANIPIVQKETINNGNQNLRNNNNINRSIENQSNGNQSNVSQNSVSQNNASNIKPSMNAAESAVGAKLDSNSASNLAEDNKIKASRKEKKFKTYHMIIESRSLEDGLSIAKNEIQYFHEEFGYKYKMAKIDSEKLNLNGFKPFIPRIEGKDLIIMRAGSLSYDVVDEIEDYITDPHDATSIVLVDVRDSFDRMAEDRPVFIRYFDIVSDVEDDEEYGNADDEISRDNDNNVISGVFDDKRGAGRRERESGYGGSGSRGIRSVESRPGEGGPGGSRTGSGRRQELRDRDYYDRDSEDFERTERRNKERRGSSKPSIDRDLESDMNGEIEKNEIQKNGIQKHETQDKNVNMSGNELPADYYDVMGFDEFANYAQAYARHIDCVIPGKTLLAMYDKIEFMQGKGLPLTKQNAEALIEEAANKAEKPGITSILRPKYDKEDKLILREENFM